MIRMGPNYLALGAMVLVAVIALFRASGNWRGKNREELDKEIEKYTK